MICSSMICSSTNSFRSKTTREIGIVALLAVAALSSTILTTGCGGGSSNSGQNTTTTPPTGSNAVALTVNAGPFASQDNSYVNGAFASVTVCTPGTSTCQTIDGVLVDTGSYGLRILSSALTTSLTQQKASDGNPVVECLPFLSGYTWGPVQTADVEMGGEKASSVPIQVINGTAYPVPTECADFGSSQSDAASLGTNGILGVGPFTQDCGTACETTGPANPGLYYECPASGCTIVGETLAQQVVNPVALFATDNNGVIIELPSAASPETSLTGSLIFGIGTQSNNALGSAQVYSIDDFGNFITSYQSKTYNESFIDSGSNGLYFLDTSLSGIAACSDANFFYCPSSTENLSATTTGASGSPSSTVNFSVANADNLPNDPVLGELAGPLSLPDNQTGFDWGLPFFYGRPVFTAIVGRTTPGGTGPYWAY
jgi:hypothetical protein